MKKKKKLVGYIVPTVDIIFKEVIPMYGPDKMEPAEIINQYEDYEEEEA